MKVLELNEKYINENQKIKSEIQNFDNNKYIIKSRPGLGLTSSYLNYSNGNLIVICPSSPIVFKKSLKKYKAHFNFFKCHQLQANQWSEVIRYLSHTPKDQQNCIITCTPESLMILKNRYDNGECNLYEILTNFPIVVDEYDTIVRQSDFRDECGRLIEIIFKDWNHNFVLSTATPNYDFIDAPDELEYIKIKKSDEKEINLKYSEKYNDAFLFIEEELRKGNKVACFSNNINIHKKKLDKLQASYTSKILCRKLDSYDVNNSDEIPDHPFQDNNLVTFSGRYFCGYDIDEDISVVIINEIKPKQKATMIDPNLAVQALFRCRGKIINAIFINVVNDNNIETLEQIDIQKKFNTEHYKFLSRFNSKSNLHNDLVTTENHVNRSKLNAQTLNEINKIILNNKEKIEDEFKKFNIQIIDYSPIKKNIENKSNLKFNERLKNLSKENSFIIKDKCFDEIESIKIAKSDSGTYSPKHLLERFTALIVKELDDVDLNNSLNNRSLKPSKFYPIINKILQKNYPNDYFSDYYQISNNTLAQIKVIQNKPKIDLQILNTWHLLFCIYNFSFKNLSVAESRVLKIYLIKNDWEVIKEFESDKKNRVKLSLNKIKSKLKDSNIILNQHEILEVQNKIKEQFKAKKHIKISESSLTNKLKKSLSFLISPSRNYNIKGNRDYNPLTQLPKFMRKYIPFRYVQLDVASANPQFVDIILGTQISQEVYDNIVDFNKITRDAAKRKYNSILNKHYLTQNEAFKFYYNECKYPSEKAKELAKLTAQVDKGSFFENMTLKESVVINYYIDNNFPNGIRLHDAIVIPEWHVPDTLPKSHYNIKFKKSYF